MREPTRLEAIFGLRFFDDATCATCADSSSSDFSGLWAVPIFFAIYER